MQQPAPEQHTAGSRTFLWYQVLLKLICMGRIETNEYSSNTMEWWIQFDFGLQIVLKGISLKNYMNFAYGNGRRPHCLNNTYLTNRTFLRLLLNINSLLIWGALCLLSGKVERIYFCVCNSNYIYHAWKHDREPGLLDEWRRLYFQLFQTGGRQIYCYYFHFSLTTAHATSALFRGTFTCSINNFKSEIWC